MTQISEVQIHFIKPTDGLIGFASLVLDSQIYLSSIGVHKKLADDGYRITYPTKKLGMNQLQIFHPITREMSLAIEQAIFEELKNVMSQSDDRYNSPQVG